MAVPGAQLILLVQSFASCFLCGLIWFVQVVHYPLLSSVGPEGFGAYAISHQRRITPVVAPVMLVEFAAAVLVVALDTGVPGWLALPGLMLVGLVWFVTFFVSVPCHAKLAGGFDRPAWRRLVLTNWIRTAGWTARALVSVWMLWEVP